MSASITSSSFVPQVPEFTESFFEPEQIQEATEPPPYSELDSKALFEAQNKTTLQVVEPKISSNQLQLYQSFLSECLHHQYQSSSFGVICPGHPEAEHPYPGPMPPDPHQDKKVFIQFVQRGVSKKFRELEREYKNNFRHWQAQMNEHILEVPKLKAKDALFLSFVSLMRSDLNAASAHAQESLAHHAFNPTALALLAVAAYQRGDHTQAADFEASLRKILPQMPLGQFGHQLIDQMVQGEVASLYLQTCEDVHEQLKNQSGVIPLEKGFLNEQIQRNLFSNLQKMKEQKVFDSLDLIGQYFLEETLLDEDDLKLSSLVDHHFGYISSLFEHLKANLDLVKAHSQNMSETLLAVLNNQVLNKEQIQVLIDELSQPLQHGNQKQKREFMHHAMHIQLYKTLFEMGAHLIKD